MLYWPLPNMGSRTKIHAAMDPAAFSANKRYHDNQTSGWCHLILLIVADDSEMLWIPLIGFCWIWHFVWMQFYKCQRCIWADAKIVARNPNCMFRECHFRCQSIATWMKLGEANICCGQCSCVFCLANLGQQFGMLCVQRRQYEIGFFSS